MSQMQFHAPPLTKINKILIIASVVGFLGNAIAKQAGFSLAPFLGLSTQSIFSGFVTTLITYPFIETGFLSFLFSSLLLWFIGSELEGKWGSKFYLKYLAVTVIGTGLFFILVLNLIFGLGGTLVGLSSINYALLLAYAMIYADRYLSFMLIFPIKARYFCMLLAGIELYSAFFSGSRATAFAHLISMLFAYIFLKFTSLRARGVSVDSIMKQRQKEKMRSKLHIVKENDDGRADPKNPKYWQ